MQVVGICKIKLFRNMVFQKSSVIFTCYQHLRRLFVFGFDMIITSKITNSALGPLFSADVPCGKLQSKNSGKKKVKKTKVSHRKHRATREKTAVARRGSMLGAACIMYTVRILYIHISTCISNYIDTLLFVWIIYYM
jgi:hypothetical protein